MSWFRGQPQALEAVVTNVDHDLQELEARFRQVFAERATAVDAAMLHGGRHD